MQLSFHLFILLLGFVLGNLFPTFFGDFLGKVGTPLFLFLALDFFNYFYYTNAFSNINRQTDENQRQRSQLNTNLRRGLRSNRLKSNQRGSWLNEIRRKKESLSSSFSSRANSLKIGFLFGLFVDAFKVGS